MLPSHLQGLSPSEIHVIAQDIQNVMASRFVTFAFFALLVYDHALTLNQEIMLVWSSGSINSVKVLFTFVRYVTPTFMAVDVAFLSGGVHGLTDETCRAWLVVDLMFELICLLSTTYIITLRVRALWTDNMEVNMMLQAVWLLNVVGVLVLLVNTLILNVESFSLEPRLNFCTAELIDIWMIWIPAMIFHVVMFILLLVKTIATPRTQHTRLLSILLVDGFIYFAVVFSAMFANMLMWAIAPLSLVQLPHYSAWAISTIATTRLLLSLQQRFHVDGGDAANHPDVVPVLINRKPNPAYEQHIRDNQEDFKEFPRSPDPESGRGMTSQIFSNVKNVVSGLSKRRIRIRQGSDDKTHGVKRQSGSTGTSSVGRFFERKIPTEGPPPTFPPGAIGGTGFSPTSQSDFGGEVQYRSRPVTGADLHPFGDAPGYEGFIVHTAVSAGDEETEYSPSPSSLTDVEEVPRGASSESGGTMVLEEADPADAFAGAVEGHPFRQPAPSVPSESFPPDPEHAPVLDRRHPPDPRRIIQTSFTST